jgi:transposase
MRKPYPTDLSDAEWTCLEPHLPTPIATGRPRIHSSREILDAIFYVLRSGCPWRLLPHDFPPWKTVFHYFRAWRIDGTWERMNRAIRERLRDFGDSANHLDLRWGSSLSWSEHRTLKATAAGSMAPAQEAASARRIEAL